MEVRLGPATGGDRVGFAATLIQPGEPLGANNVDDVGEMLPAGSRSTQHRDQAIALGIFDRLLDD
jgi:hypothetical protein